ncbi:MAG: ABC transporter substrate-binding protein [Eubacteriales bacterium]|nr:ABC transporter substrate-binding protein [Eubacteriales bacterium]
MKKHSTLLRIMAALVCALMLTCALPMSVLADEAPTELVIGFFSLNGIPKDLQMVMDAVNEILIQEINVKITPIIANFGNYHEQLNLMLSGNEQIDTFMCWGTYWLNYYNKGQIIELDDLLAQYGQGIVDVIGQEWLDAGRINGQQYGLTTNRDLALTRGLVFVKDVCDKYGIDPAQVKTLDDVAAVYQTLKEKEPDMIPLASSSSGAGLLDTICTFDPLGDTLGVLTNYGEKLEVVNYFDTQEYEDYCRYFHEWYLKGYITEDVLTSTDDSNAMMRNGRAFSNTSNLKPGFDIKQSATVGREVVGVPMVEPFTSSSVVQTCQWYIAANCEHPDKAMQFLNLMYTDKRITNLLAWGIEGVHYVVTEDGHITYPEGVNSDNIGYALNLGWMFGNQFQTYVWEGDPIDLYQQLSDFNNSAKKSAAFGFTWDPAPVKTEIAALNNILNEYRVGLEWGVLDPDTALPEFRAKLKAAGIDKVVEEKQRQLDAWALTVNK